MAGIVVNIAIGVLWVVCVDWLLFRSWKDETKDSKEDS